ncbi:MAG: flippase-like domain-containing protein [Actinobacteria bacterium]|nr:flippase-like domain-containing protein [Actinomycetota bacterium]
MKRKLINVIRVLVSAALLVFLILKNRGNFGIILHTLKSINIYFLIMGLFFYTIGIAIIPLRWGILLKAHGHSISFAFLLQSAFIGFFYNNLLPTGVGGDFYRVYDVYKNRHVPVSQNISAVVMERIMGMVSGIIFLVFSFVFGTYRYLARNTLLGLGIVLIIVTLFFAVLFRPRFFKIDVLLRKFKVFSRLRPGLRSFHDALIYYWKKKNYMIISLLYSFLLQSLLIISHYFVSISMGLGLLYYHFIYIVPFASLAAAVPITIGGIGIRENALVFALKNFGIGEGSATLFSFIMLSFILFNALLGGMVYIIKNLFYRSKGYI